MSNLSRRDFLKELGIGAVCAAGVLVLPNINLPEPVIIEDDWDIEDNDDDISFEGTGFNDSFQSANAFLMSQLDELDKELDEKVLNILRIKNK